MRIPSVLALFTSCLLLSANVTADFEKGLTAYEAGDYEAAIQEWKPLAEQGNADAQNNLGVIYENGRGVIQDYKEAVKWYTKAAEQGVANAQFNLALMYERSMGVLQDYKEAVKWYTKAAEQGNANAQGNLGFMYGNGNGVLQDDVYAHMWFNIASSNGAEKAGEGRALIAERMTPAQLAEAQKLARECVKKDYRNC